MMSNPELNKAFIQLMASQGQIDFDYDFYISEMGELIVLVDGNSVELHDVSNTGNANGGEVSLMNPLNEGQEVTITRRLFVTRKTNFTANGDLSAKLLNDEFNSINYLLQQSELHDNRTIAFSEAVNLSEFNLGIPSPVSNASLRANNDNTGFTWVDDEDSPLLHMVTQQAADAESSAQQALVSENSAQASADTATQKADITIEQVDIAVIKAGESLASSITAQNNSTSSSYNADIASEKADIAITNASISQSSANESRQSSDVSIENSDKAAVSANEAQVSATNSLQYSELATTRSNESLDSATLSGRYSNYPEDSVIPGSDSEFSAKHYSIKAQKALSEAIVSGGLHDPTENEYPNVEGITKDTIWPIASQHVYQTGVLVGSVASPGDMLFYDTPENIFSLISSAGTSIQSINGKVGSNVILIASDIGAVDETVEVNGQPLSSNVNISMDSLGYTGDNNANYYTHPSYVSNDIIGLSGATVVSTVNTNDNGHVTELATREISASDIGAASKNTQINGKALTSDITLNANDIGAIANTVTINGQPLSSDVTITLESLGHAETGEYIHPEYSSSDIDVTGATVVSAISTNDTGHITDLQTRELTPSDIGALDLNSDNTISNGVNTTLNMVSDDSGLSTLNVYGGESATGQVYVGQDINGGGIAFNGSSDSSTSGAGTDYLNLFTRNEGDDSWVIRSKYNVGDIEVANRLYVQNDTGESKEAYSGHNLTSGTSAPSGGNDGDVYIQYT